LVSPSLKILEKLNMIRAIRGKGREKLYELAMSFIYSSHKFMFEKLGFFSYLEYLSELLIF